jgi:hypothetical protein
MPKSDAAAELAGKLIASLRRQRDQNDAYPLTVAQLAALAAPEASPELLKKSLGKKQFTEQAILAQKKAAEQGLVALKEDAERLAASPLVLEFALEQLCSPASPLHSLAKVAGTIDRSLRPAFLAALQRRLGENALPPGVGCQTVRNKPHLFLHRFPPPPPPSPPHVALAEKLVRVLESGRGTGGEANPVRLRYLLETTDPSAPPALVKKALAAALFRGRAVLAWPYKAGADPLVALAEDADRLAVSDALLEAVLAIARTADNQAATIADLTRKIGRDLQRPFADTLVRRLETGSLPPAIGSLRIKKKQYLFLTRDVGVRIPTPTSLPSPKAEPPLPAQSIPALDFAPLFDAAFARLDRERGGHNLVNLVSLRQAIPVDRATFDAELQRMRRAGRYSLSAAEGRHGLSPQEQAAAFREDGALLLFVSRRGS